MQTPRTAQRGTIREDVAALRQAHDDSMRSLAERLDGIAARLDQINGTVRRHDNWIAGHEPVSSAALDNLKALSECVQKISDYLSEERGAKKARARLAVVGNALLTAVISLGALWAGFRWHP